MARTTRRRPSYSAQGYLGRTRKFTSLLVREVPREPESEIIESEERAKKLLQEAKDTVKAKQVVTKYLVTNSVADAIIDYCRQIGCDMIVTGSRGLSRIKKAILGSVSSELMAKSPVPVLVVK